MRRLDDGTPELPADGTASFVADYLSLPLDQRRALRRRIVQRRRSGLADALIGAPLADRERAALLATCSPAVAAAQLPGLAELIPNLGAFARRHPDLLLTELRRRTVGASVAERNAAWSWADAGLRRLAQLRPGEVAQLLATAGPSTGLPEGIRRQAGGMLAAAPEAMIEVLITSLSPNERGCGGQPPSTGVLRRFPKLPPALRQRLLKSARNQHRSVAAYLGALPPSARAAAFTATYDDVATHARRWEPELLAVLPHTLRQAEIARMLELPVPDRAASTLLLAGFTSPAEAARLVAPYRRSSNLQHRGSAWHAMLSAALRSGDKQAINEAFGLFGAASLEASPVKSEALMALRLAPIASLTAVTPERWAAVVRMLLDAPEAARECFMLENALWRVLSYQAQHDTVDPDLVAVQLSLPRDSDHRWAAHLRLGPAAASRLVVAFEPHLADAPAAVVVALARPLIGRLSQHPHLLARLENLPLDRATWWQSDALTAVIAEPTARGERLAQLLERIPALITHGLIQNAVCRYRPDLAHLLYAPRPEGERWPGNAHGPEVAAGPFSHWGPDESGPYSLALARFVAASEGSRWLKLHAARTIAHLPYLDDAVEETLLGAEEPALREAGFAALARSRAVEWELPELLGLLESPYAATLLRSGSTPVGHLPPAEAHDLLRLVAGDPKARLGVRKLAIAWLARLRYPGTAEEIAHLALHGSTHQDVRAAAARALLDFLDANLAWEALERVAQEHAALVRIRPEQLVPRHRARFARLLLSAPATPELADSLSRWLPYSSQALERLAGLVTDPGQDVRDAAVAGLAAGIAGLDWDVPLRLVTEVATLAERPEEPNATEDADLPHLRLLNQLVSALIPSDAFVQVERRQDIVSLAELLGSFPLTQRLSWQAWLAAVNWTDPLGELTRLAALASDSMHAHELLSLTRRQVAAVRASSHQTKLAQAVDVLLSAGDAATGAIALALITEAGQDQAWTPQWRERLRRARVHPVRAIANWAHDVPALPGVIG